LYDYQNAIPDPTKKDAVINNGYIGVAGKGELNKSYTINDNYIPDPTRRNQTENVTHINPAIMHEGQKTRTREDMNNSLVNIGKERVNIIRDEGQPTTCNYDIGPMYDFTMTELKEPIQIKRDVYGSQPWGNPLECVDTAYTRQPTQVPNANWRLDPCTLSGLSTNPFINNVVFKYVEY
jgi:hypothetical protein